MDAASPCRSALARDSILPYALVGAERAGGGHARSYKCEGDFRLLN
jgi:hypothetical protein